MAKQKLIKFAVKTCKFIKLFINFFKNRPYLREILNNV